MKTSLYITYDGLLDPLGQSQIIPYLYNLNSKGYKFIIISFEKIHENKLKIQAFRKELEHKGFEWIILPFKKGKINFLGRLISGSLQIKKILLSRKIHLVHLRGCYPGLIFKLTLSNTKYLYDLRAFFGQWADGGITRYN